MNRTDHWTYHFLEACWLVALVSIPVYFNIGTARIFEPDKALLLRSIALIMTGLWVIRLIDGRRVSSNRGVSDGRSLNTENRGRSLTVTALVASVILFGLTTVTATFLSVSIRESFFGSYLRTQGLLTFLSYVMLFASISRLVRTERQIERIIFAMIIGSLPVAVYGVLQHFGTDPIPWGADNVSRIASTMGNPIFASAYLILTVPATLVGIYHVIANPGRQRHPRVHRLRVVASFVVTVLVLAAWTMSPRMGSAVSGFVVLGAISWRRSFSFSVTSAIRWAALLLVLGLQLAAILFAQSRGPMLGLLAGSLFLGLVWFRRHVSDRLRIWTLSALLTLGVGMVIGLTQPTVQESIRGVPYLGRFADALSAEGTVRVRTLIWGGVSDLIHSNPARTVFGFGPETLPLVYPSFFPPDLAAGGRRREMPDRSHNELLDVLVERGAFGLFSYLGLISLALFGAVSVTGSHGTSRNNRMFFAILSVSVVLTTAATLLFDRGFRWLGIASAAGMLIGLYVYLACSRVPRFNVAEKHRAVAGAVLFALAAHFTESQFGFGVVATYMQFWVWTGLLVAALVVVHENRKRQHADHSFSSDRKALENRSVDGKRKNPIGPHPATEYAWLIGIVLIVLMTNFLRLQGVEFTRAGITWLIVLSWIGLTAVLPISGDTTRSGAAIVRHGLIAATIFGVALVVVVGLGAYRYTAEFHASFGFVAVVLIVACTGWSLYSKRAETGKPLPVLMRWRAGLILAGATGAVYGLCYLPIRADVAFNQGRIASARTESQPNAISYFVEATRYVPGEDYYFLFEGKAWLEAATAAPEGQSKRLYDEAERALTEALRLSPYNVDHTANLARYYDTRAGGKLGHTPELHDRAMRYADRMVTMSPGVVSLRREAAAIAERAGDLEAATKHLRTAIETDSTYVVAYVDLARLTEKTHSAKEAYELLESGLKRGAVSVNLLSHLAIYADRIGKLTRALQALEEATVLDSKNATLYENAIVMALRGQRCEIVKEWIGRMSAAGLTTEASRLDIQSRQVCSVDRDGSEGDK